MLRETMHGGGASPQQPGDGLEETEPKPKDVLERPCLNSKGFRARGGSLAVAQLLRRPYNTQVRFSSWSCLWEDEAGVWLCAPFQLGAPWSGSAFAFNEKNSSMIFPCASSSSCDSCVVFLCCRHKPSLPCFEIPTADHGKCLHCSWHLLIFFRWLRAAGIPHYFFISQFEYSFSLTKRVMVFNSSFRGVCAEPVLGPQ